MTTEYDLEEQKFHNFEKELKIWTTVKMNFQKFITKTYPEPLYIFNPQLKKYTINPLVDPVKQKIFQYITEPETEIEFNKLIENVINENNKKEWYEYIELVHAKLLEQII